MKVIAEIGINHNGDINLALEMIKKAKESGANIVKFQKRSPYVCVPKSQWNMVKSTPWGIMSYIEYKTKIEFGKIEYDKINELCKEIGIEWTVSVWDIPSFNFMMNNYRYDIPFIKIPSAKITDVELIKAIREYDIKVLMSTGMSTIDEIFKSIDAIGNNNFYGLLICNSTYPSNISELDMDSINYFRDQILNQDVLIGYSGHEIGYIPSIVACSMGAEIIERHFTTDKKLWGTDQSCSLEPHEFKKMCDTFGDIAKIKGSYLPKCYDSELIIKNKLR